MALVAVAQNFVVPVSKNALSSSLDGLIESYRSKQTNALLRTAAGATA